MNFWQPQTTVHLSRFSLSLILSSVPHYALFCTPMGFDVSVLLNALDTVYQSQLVSPSAHPSSERQQHTHRAQKQTIHPSQTLTLSKCLLTEHFL